MQVVKHVTAPDEIQRSWRLTLALCVMVLLGIIATAILTAGSLSRLSVAREGVTHARLADNSLKDLMVQILNAETGQRGFLLSGHADYLQPYFAALAQLREARAALGLVLHNEPSVAADLDTLDQAIALKLQELDRTVTLKSEGKSDEALALVLTDSGKQAMDAVRDVVRVLMTSGDRRTELWETALAQELFNNYLIVAASIAINLIMFVLLVLRLRYASAQVRTSRQAMKERNDIQSSLLESSVARNAQVHGLSELSRLLQSCVDMDEAVRVLQQELPLLMRSTSGALYLMAVARDQLRQSFSWGTEPYAESFNPSNCWAVRLGQSFQQPAQMGAAACAHLQTEEPHEHADIHCLPLVAHGELMGVLVLDAGIASDQQVNAENEGYRRIALEQVGLSIGNLKLRESLRQQSIRDALTGLYNRRFLEESAQREVQRAVRREAQGCNDGMALLMIDIDNFKQVNDQHGHEVGDQVLCQVATILHRQTRGSDVAARYGGEEFTIILAEMPPGLALERAEKVRAEVEALTLQASGKTLGTVTISIGLAYFPAHGNTVEALLLAADKALYEAKHAGRNRVVVAT